MNEPEASDPRNRNLVEALQQLQPAAMRTSREQLWYRAGLEAGRWRTNLWKAATLIMMMAVGVMMWVRLAPQGTAERVVQVKQTPPPAIAVVVESEEEQASAEAYYRLRDAIARDGLAALPRVEAGNRGSAPPERRGGSFEF